MPPAERLPEEPYERHPEWAADLLAWFRRNARDLPWRRSRTPYRSLVSEFMLQQTRVATVVPRFEAFLERFETVERLAAAHEDDVLKAWEGLGYYRRARNLHAAAREIVLVRAGVFPTTLEGWRSLPGVGAYTAAALASVLDGIAAVAVDGNVRRVAARIHAIEGAVSERHVERLLTPALPATAAGAFNEALMELGATVCTPRAPACDACPLRGACRAASLGTPERFPQRSARGATPERRRFAAVYIRSGRLLLVKRPTDAMLGGLWGFPLLDEPPPGTPLGTPDGNPLGEVTHAYSHFRLRVTPLLLDPARSPLEHGLPPDAELVSFESLTALALSTLDHKILALLRTAHVDPAAGPAEGRADGAPPTKGNGTDSVC